MAKQLAVSSGFLVCPLRSWAYLNSFLLSRSVWLGASHEVVLQFSSKMRVSEMSSYSYILKTSLDLLLGRIESRMLELNLVYLTEEWTDWSFGWRPLAQHCVVAWSCSQMTALHIAASPCPCTGLPPSSAHRGSGFLFVTPISANRAYLLHMKKSQSSLVKLQGTKCLRRKLICFCFWVKWHTLSRLQSTTLFNGCKQVGSKVHTFILLQNQMIRNILMVWFQEMVFWFWFLWT